MDRDLSRSSARGPLALVLLLVAACAADPPPPTPVPEPVPIPASGGGTLLVAGDAPSEPEVQVAGKPAVPPLEPGARDSRKSVLSPRATALLVAEQHQLEALYAATARSSPDRPTLARRIAEGYVELASAEARDQKESADRARVARSKKVERAARVQAIKYYKLLEAEFPKYCYPIHTSERPAQGCLDEVLYFMGLEHEALGNHHEARVAYLKLVQSYPKSPLTPYAYLGFGEIFLIEAVADPMRWTFVLQSYEEVAKFKESPAAAVARGRVALVCGTMGAAEAEPELCARLGAAKANVAQ